MPTDTGGGGGGGGNVTATNGQKNGSNIKLESVTNGIKSENQELVKKKTTGLATAQVVVPPDGGFGWVIMVASFFCNTIVDGIVMNAGSFAGPIREEFGATQSQVALVSSLLSGFYLIAGPFVSALANKWGFRPVTIIGSIIASFGFAMCYFASNVYYLYLFYGVIGGIGFCLIYIPSVITVGYYFERWRALATGIAMCGSGVGTFLFAPVNSKLIINYGWRMALIIQSVIILSCGLLGLLYRPLKPIEVTIETTLGDDDEMEIKEEKRLPAMFSKPLPEGRFAYSVPNSVHNTWIGASNNTQYPTAAEVFRGSGANLDRRPSGNVGTTTVLNASNIHSTTKKLEQLSKAQRAMNRQNSGTTPQSGIGVGSGSSISNAVSGGGGQTTPDDVFAQPPTFNQHKELNTVGEAEEENENDNLLVDGEVVKPGALQGRRHTVSGRRPQLPGSKGGSRRGTVTDNRPLYRDDIFFSGSMARIPNYQSQSSLGYHMSVTRLPTQQDVDEEEEKSCVILPEAVRRTLATMLDMSLLKSPSFMLLALSGFLTMMGFFVPFLFVVPRAVNGEMDKDIALFIISAIGISNTVARIVCGMLGSIKSVKPLYINNVFITLGGLATIFSGLSITPAYQFTFAIIFGVAIACFSALRSIIAVELLGLEKLTNAFGILMLFQGLAAVVGTPIAGILYDATNSYDYSFYFSGGLITISALLCYPLNMVNKWEKNKNAKKNEQKSAI